MADASELEDEPVVALRRAFLEFREDTASSDLVLVASRRCVDDGNIKKMVDAFLHPDNKDVLEYTGWELIGILTLGLSNSTTQCSNHIKDCKMLLEAIAVTCNPKEVCLGVLERLDSGPAPAVFSTLLHPLQKAISRVKSRKSKVIKMALPQIVKHLKTMRQIMHETDQTPDDTGSNCTSMAGVLAEVVAFLEALIEDVAQLQSGEAENNEEKVQQQALIKCLVSILDYPFVFINLSLLPTDDICNGDKTSSENNKVSLTPYRDLGEKIMRLLDKVKCSCVYLMEYASWHTRLYNKVNNMSSQEDAKEQDNDEQTEVDLLPLLGLSCYCYLVLVEDSVHFPQVFSPKYLLKTNMMYIACLLGRTDNQVIYKGLELLFTLIKQVQDGSLEHYFLDFPGVLDMSKALINVMIMCTSRNLRQKAVKSLPLFLSKFDTRGRYMLLRFLLHDCPHAGVAGLLIQAVKEEVNRSLNSPENDVWFQKSQLISIMQLVYKLPRGSGREVDLVPETDRLMAALNCLRFILLRDRDDKTTVWKNYAMFEKEFLNPLREALRLARLNYQVAQREKEDEMKGKVLGDKKNEDTSVDFSVRTPDGQPISMMPVNEQLQVLQSGLYAMDMMECILSHITEIENSRR